jgi:hypothetical protein
MGDSELRDEEIKRRLDDLEDGWTERKPKNVDKDLVCKALVAFANSVPEGEEAILFIGVDDKGKPIGVENPDKLQKTIRRWADWCYPPIRHTSRVLEVDGKYIVAVIVQADHNRPHFAGPAFVRVGSESPKASEPVFNELIASRLSKARPLLEAKRKGELVSVSVWPFGFGGDDPIPGIPEDCSVIECTPHVAVFQPKLGPPISGEYDQMRLSKINGTQWHVDLSPI